MFNLSKNALFPVMGVTLGLTTGAIVALAYSTPINPRLEEK
jgi:hypothetical protein